MSESLVSIIIPAWNAGRYIKEAIDSAIDQTYKNIEIIVVDDGSTDNTKDVIAPFIESHKIKYIYQENKGLSGARNTGIKNSNGEYIALLDSDDIFLPDKIKEQVTQLEEFPNCDVSYCDLYHFWDNDPERLLKLNYKYYSGSEVFPNLLARSFIAPVTVVFRKNVFEKFGYFDENIRQFAEDIEFWLRISYRGANIFFLPKILAKLRLRKEGNIQSNQPMMKITALKVIANLSEKMSPAEKERYGMEKHLRRYSQKAAFAYLMVGDKKQALNLLSNDLVLRSVVYLVPTKVLKFLVTIARKEKQLLFLKKA